MKAVLPHFFFYLREKDCSAIVGPGKNALMKRQSSDEPNPRGRKSTKPRAASVSKTRKIAAPAPEPAPKVKRAPKSRLKIPAILLEGDESPAPAVGGPGQRF